MGRLRRRMLSTPEPAKKPPIINENQYGQPGEYIKKRSGGWWLVQEDGSYRTVKGQLIAELDAQFARKGKS